MAMITVDGAQAITVSIAVSTDARTVLIMRVNSSSVSTGVSGMTTLVSWFEIPDGRFGVLICYEGIFPALTRRFVDGGADFLVNITNDAWYGRTAAPHQHLVQASFRAIENRVPLVRAANTGISAVIDPDGRIRWQSPLFEMLWHVDEIRWTGVRTFYARFGDVFVWLCVVVTALGVARTMGRRTR